MHGRLACEFFLMKYVPDPVRNEFVHVGVIVRQAGGPVASVKFTSDWRRVRCLDPDADVEMLEGLGSELRRRFEEEPDGNLMHVLEDSFSNSVQVTRARGYLAESVSAGVDALMRMYVEPPKRERTPRLAGRAAIQAEMRSEFERAGVWDLLRKKIAASEYTRAGDPLRIDAGYRSSLAAEGMGTGGMIRMFQAVSLEGGVEMAKVLAFSASGLMDGVRRVDRASLELTAVVEPVRRGMGDRTGDRQQATGNRTGDRQQATGDGGQGTGDRTGDRRQATGDGGQGTGDRTGDRTGGKTGNGQQATGEPGPGIGNRGLGEGLGGDGLEDSERMSAYRFAVETMEEHRIRVVTTLDLERVAETARRELRV